MRKRRRPLPSNNGRPALHTGLGVWVLLIVLGAGLVPTAQAVDEDPALEQYFIASAAYNRKLYPVAVAQFGGFLQKHPNHAKADLARRGLGISLYALKQYDKARPHFAALLAKPNLDRAISRDRILMLQGRCLLNTGKKDEARQLFIANHPKIGDPAFRAAALASVCDISFEKSEWDKVLEWTTQLLRLKTTPDQNARGLYQRGYAFYSTEKLEEAAAEFAKIAPLATTPEWKTRGAYLQGECHNRLEQFDKAEPAFAAALPGMEGAEAADCRYRLAVVRFLLEKYEPAAADFEAYRKEAKPDAEGKPAPHLRDAQLYFGRCKLALEDYPAAEREFQQLSVAEDLIAAKANLWWARTHSRRGENFERAADILRPAVEKFKSSPVIDELDFDYANAEVSRKAPEWKAAADALQRVEARGKFPQLPEVLSQRATCLHMLKDYNGSLAVSQNHLARFADQPQAGDMRFLRSENLFLLNRADQAAKAYGEFLASHKDHPSVLAAEFRLAQIHHHASRWNESLASAKPLLAKKPEGRLFAQLSFIVGDCYFRTEKWAEAIQPLEDFIATRVKIDAPNRRTVTVEPNVDTGLMQLAIAYDRTAKPDKALDHLLTLVSFYLQPTAQLPLALSEQGRLAYTNKDLKLARAALERFINEDKADKEPFKRGAPPERPRVMYYLGWVEADEGKAAKAAEYFAQVPRGHALGADAALQHGIALVNTENFELAAKHFPQMLNLFREHEQLELVIYYSGLSTARREDWGNAANYFKRLIDSYPASEFADEALYEWAWCERARKRDKEATALYEQLLAKHPKSEFVIKVQSELAELNLDSGAQDAVIAKLTETLKGMKDEALREPIRIQLASAHYKKADHEMAAKLFEELITDYPESKLRASMLFQAGESRLQLKETVAARDHFDAASKIGGTAEILAESIMMRLGETQAMTDMHDQAAHTYRQFLGRFKESKWLRNAQFGLGYALERGDKPDPAIVEYAKLLTDPKLVDLWTVRGRFQTGECHFNRQRYDQAVAEFVNIEINYNKYPSWQAKAVLEIGRVLHAQDKKEEATERFKGVIAKFPKENAAVVARQYLDELRKR